MTGCGSAALHNLLTSVSFVKSGFFQHKMSEKILKCFSFLCCLVHSEGVIINFVMEYHTCHFNFLDIFIRLKAYVYAMKILVTHGIFHGLALESIV